MVKLARALVLIAVLFPTGSLQAAISDDWSVCPELNGDIYRLNPGDLVAVSRGAIPLRQEPGEQSYQVATLYDGDILTIISEAMCSSGKDIGPRFYRVTAKSGLTGWVPEHSISPYARDGGFYAIGDLVFSPDGKYLMVSLVNTAAWLWDIQADKKMDAVVGDTTMSALIFSAGVFTPDGKSILGIDGPTSMTFSLYDVKSGQPIRSFKGHLSIVNSIALSPDGRFALSGSGDVNFEDSSARLWDVGTATQIKIFQADDYVWVNKVLFSPDGKFIFVDAGPFIAQYDVTTFVEVYRYEDSSLIAITPDGKQLLINENSPKLYVVGPGTPIHTYAIKEGLVGAVFTRDGKYFVAQTRQSLALWQKDSEKIVRVFSQPQTGSLKSAAPIILSPDDQYLYSGSNASGTVMVWDMKTGFLVRTFSMYQER
jgi:WD40 repeat protein